MYPDILGNSYFLEETSCGGGEGNVFNRTNCFNFIFVLYWNRSLHTVTLVLCSLRLTNELQCEKCYCTYYVCPAKIQISLSDQFLLSA